jgi:hypothetical protein
LTVLCLDNCNFIKNDQLVFICNSCHNLTHLSLSSCQQICQKNKKDATVFDPFAQISKLVKLEILNLYRTFISDDAMKDILKSCHNLRFLNLGGNTTIKSFNDILELISIYSYKTIEGLDLWYAFSTTNDGLSKIAQTCHNLEELDIGWW